MTFSEHSELAGYIARQCEHVKGADYSPETKQYLLGVQRGFYLGICQGRGWEVHGDILRMTCDKKE